MVTGIMTYFSHIRAGLFSAALLLTTALASPAMAESLPEISPRQIAGDVKVQYNPDNGTREYIAPTFDPFEEDETMAGTANLRSVGNAVTIDGNSVRGGALLDMTFYYSSPTSDPYDIRGYEEAVFLSDDFAPVTLRDNRVLECSEKVTETIYHHDNYYSPSLYLNFYRPYRHYGGHYRFRHSRFGNRYGYGARRGYRGYARGYNRGYRQGTRGHNDRVRDRRRDRDGDRVHDRRRDEDDRRTRDRRRDEDRTRDRRRDDDSRRGRNARRDNSDARARRDNPDRERRIVRRDRDGAMWTGNRGQRMTNGDEGRTTRNADRPARSNRRSESRTNRQATPRPATNNSRRERTDRTVRPRNNNAARNRNLRADNPRANNSANTRRAAPPAVRAANPAPRPAPAARPAPAPKKTPATRRYSPPKKAPAARSSRNVDRAVDKAFKRSNPRGNLRRKLDFFPKASSWSRRAVTNVNTQCAREERLTVHIPRDRLDASRFDGLTVLVLDRAGREIPVYIPPNYVEGFRLAKGGGVSSAPRTYTPPRGSAPGYQEPNPYPSTLPIPHAPVETAPCPTGTAKQPDGTCLTTAESYRGYP